jgi:hypothetical protein
LTFGERDYFFEDEPDLAPAVTDFRKFIRASSAVVNSFLGASNDLRNTLSGYPSFSLDQSHRHNTIAF